MCIEPPRPPRGAVDAAEELGHHALRVGAARDRVAVRAVGADQVVVVAHHRGGADDRRLLADREVQEAAGLGLLVLSPAPAPRSGGSAPSSSSSRQLVGRSAERVRPAEHRPLLATGPPLARRATASSEPVVAPEDLVADDHAQARR